MPASLIYTTVYFLLSLVLGSAFTSCFEHDFLRRKKKRKRERERVAEREEKEEDEGKRIKKRRPLVPIFTPADSRMLAGTSFTWLTTSRVSTFYLSIFNFKSILSKIDPDL